MKSKVLSPCARTLILAASGSALARAISAITGRIRAAKLIFMCSASGNNLARRIEGVRPELGHAISWDARNTVEAPKETSAQSDDWAGPTLDALDEAAAMVSTPNSSLHRDVD